MASEKSETDGTINVSLKAVPPDLALIAPAILTEHSPSEEPTHEEDSSINLPQTWSSTRKWAIVCTIALIAFVVNWTIAICAPATLAIADEFNNHNGFIMVFYLTVWNLGESIAALYVAPLSERFGRVPMYHFCNFMFTVFTMATGFSHNFATMTVLRFMTGASVSACMNASTVGDLFPVETRGAAMSAMSLIPLVGSATGPVLGGYITQAYGWRWTFWMTSIVNAVVSLILVLALKETYLPVLRARARNQSREKVKQVFHLEWATVKNFPRLAVRPFRILFSYRAAAIVVMYLSLVYAYFFVYVSTLGTTMQEVYGFSESKAGLFYIAVTVGMLIGTLLCRFTLDYCVANGIAGMRNSNTPEDKTKRRAENRLIPIIPAMMIFPVSLFLYGWSLEARIHWIAPTIATALSGFCMSSSTIPVLSYLVDVFGDRSASAVAAFLPMRYVIGTFLPSAAPYMYAALGYGWAMSMFAFILLVVVPVPLLVIIQPRRLEITKKLVSKTDDSFTVI